MPFSVAFRSTQFCASGLARPKARHRISEGKRALGFSKAGSAFVSGDFRESDGAGARPGRQGVRGAASG